MSNELDEIPEFEPIHIYVPEQGVDFYIRSRDDVSDWTSREMDFWEQVRKPLDTNIRLGEHGYQLGKTAQSIRTEINEMGNRAGAGDYSQIGLFVEQARRLNVICADGKIAQSVLDSIQTNDIARTASICSIFHTRFRASLQSSAFGLFGNMLEILRDVHPLFDTQFDLIEADTVMKASKSTATDVERLRTNHEEWICEKKRDIKELENTYREKLRLEEPATYWSKKATEYGCYAILAFVGFVLIIAIAVFALGSQWSEVIALIQTLTQGKGGVGGFVGSFAIITVPVLTIAWFLKHVSRVFVQNLALRADAENRNMIIYTYLALVNKPDSGFSPKDRALILNAISRPPPTQQSDDGPPVGLLDLIKDRKPE